MKALVSNKKVFYGLIWAVILIVLALLPFMGLAAFHLRIVILSLIAVMVGTGLDLVVGLTGQLSPCQGAFFGMGAYITAILMVKARWNFFVAELAAILVVLLVGGLLGVILLRMKGHYLAIVTIGFTVVFNQVVTNWIDMTGGPLGMPGIPRPQPFNLGEIDVSWTQNQNFYFLVFVPMVILVFIAYRIKVSKLGSVLRTIREDEIAAAHIGVNITRYKVVAFALSALYAGAAGGFYASFSGILAPDLFGVVQSANFLVMATIGGLGSILGVAISTFALTLLPDLLRGFAEWRDIVYGLLLLVTVIFLPQGLASSFRVLGIRLPKSWLTEKSPVARLNRRIDQGMNKPTAPKGTEEGLNVTARKSK